MNINDNVFKKVYLNIVNEEVKTSSNNKRNVESPDPEKIPDTGNAPIDDLTKENSITIEEDSMDSIKDDEVEDPNDGWGEKLSEKLSYLLEDLENFAYEIRNCVKGAYTGCKTKEQLADYMINTLAENLKIEAEDLYNE